MENVNSQQDLQSTQKETGLSRGTFPTMLQLNCKGYFWFNGCPRWSSYQEQPGSHWSPLNIKETSKPGSPLPVNDLKLRREVISWVVVGCLWSFVLPKHQLQVPVWIECHEANLLTNMRLVLLPVRSLQWRFISCFFRGYCVLPLLWQGCLQCLLISSPLSVLLLNHPSSFVTSQCLDRFCRG